MSRAAFTRAEPDARRRSLIEATARALACHGAAGVSVRAICAEAGVSPGLLRHYFDGVDALVAATYEHVGGQVAHALADAVAAAGDSPRDRLLAYVTASFAPPISDPALLATWLAFWSLVKSNPEIARLHGAIYRDYRRIIEDLVTECAGPGADARLVAIALGALVDGLWLELSLDPTIFTRDEACAVAERWVEALLADPRFG